MHDQRQPVTRPAPPRRHKTLSLISLGPGVPIRHQQRLMFWVNKTSQLLLARAHAALAPLGIEPREYVVLLRLAEAGPCSQQQLSVSLNLDQNLMVTLIDRLEHAALVERTVDPHDRRAHAVSLRLQGRRTLVAADAQLDRLEAEVFGRLSPGETTQLTALLRRIHGA